MSALRDNEDVTMTVFPTGNALDIAGAIRKPMFDSSETAIIKNLCLNSDVNSGTSYTYNSHLCVYLVNV